ncbi:MAG: DUF3196 family protein [Erysipelotrichaceae bacterium]|nr:DUF3196 family protein [Erysipelotrichaceae bacterium]
MPDSYYDDLLQRMRQLVQNEQYETAVALAKEEFSMPYIPAKVQEELEALYKQAATNLIRPSKVAYLSNEQLEEYLFGDKEELALRAAMQLSSSNLREHLALVQRVLRLCGFRSVQALLIEALISQQVSEEFTVIKQSLQVNFIPSQCRKPQESEGLLAADAYLEEWFEKEPSMLELAKKILWVQVYLNLPLSYNRQEGLPLAAGVAWHLYESMGLHDWFGGFCRQHSLDPDYRIVIETDI